MFIKLALTVEDLLKAIDYDTERRAQSTSASLSRFDPKTGTLTFTARSAGSRHTWQQTVVLTDWNFIIESFYDEYSQGNVEPEIEFEPEEDEEGKPLVQPAQPVQIAQPPNVESMPWDQVRKEIPEVELSDVKVHCNCPAFQYWGSHYTLDQLDSAITPENRFPSVRDPNMERTLCKHLISVFKRFF